MANPEDGLSADDKEVLLAAKRHWFFFLDVRLRGASWYARERLEKAGLLQEGSYLLTPKGRAARGRLQLAQLDANLEEEDHA